MVNNYKAFDIRQDDTGLVSLFLPSLPASPGMVWSASNYGRMEVSRNYRARCRKVKNETIKARYIDGLLEIAGGER